MALLTSLHLRMPLMVGVGGDQTPTAMRHSTGRGKGRTESLREGAPAHQERYRRGVLETSSRQEGTPPVCQPGGAAAASQTPFAGPGPGVRPGRQPDFFSVQM
jgi:hypothetical protein